MLTPLEKLLVSALTNLEGIAHRYGGENPRHDTLHAATASARAALAAADAQEQLARDNAADPAPRDHNDASDVPTMTRGHWGKGEY